MSHEQKQDAVERLVRTYAEVVRMAFYSGDYHAALRNIRSVFYYLDQGMTIFDGPEFAAFQKLVGKVYLALRMPCEAEAAIQSAMSIHPQQGEADAETLSLKRHLAECCRQKKSYAEAEALYRTCIEAAKEISKIELAKAYLGLAQICIDQDKLTEAETAIERARLNFEVALASRDFWIGRCKMTEARLRYTQGRVHEATQILDEAMNIIMPRVGPDHPLRAQALSAMGRLLKKEGQMVMSQEMFEEAERVDRFLKIHDR